MNGVLVLVLVCAAAIPRAECTPATARVSLALRIEAPMCGVGAIAALAQNPAGPRRDEYSVIRCRM